MHHDLHHDFLFPLLVLLVLYLHCQLQLSESLLRFLLLLSVLALDPDFVLQILVLGPELEVLLPQVRDLSPLLLNLLVLLLQDLG